MQLPILTLDMINQLAHLKREQIKLEFHQQAWLSRMQTELDVGRLASMPPGTDIVDMHDEIRELSGGLKQDLDLHLALAGIAIDASRQLQPLRAEIAQRLPGASAVGVSENCVARKVMKLETAFEELGLRPGARVGAEVQFVPAAPVRSSACLASAIEIDTLAFTLERTADAWIATGMECVEAGFNDPEVVEIRLPPDAVRGHA